MLKLFVCNIQNLENAKFYSCQIKLVYSIPLPWVLMHQIRQCRKILNDSLT